MHVPETSKICPVLSQPWMDECFPTVTQLIAKEVACKEDNCAWWDGAANRCVIKTIAVNLLWKS